ncbi:MAG: hypothetical protein CV089_02165 [Nitrospira sp. WS110]|nr:hypothetical protein [Nitrospira sp. WS110]
MANILQFPTEYPAVIDYREPLTGGQTGADISTSHINNPVTATLALETVLGTNPQGSAPDVKTRLSVALDNDGKLKGATSANRILYSDGNKATSSENLGADGMALIFKETPLHVAPLGTLATLQAMADPGGSGKTVLAYRTFTSQTVLGFSPGTKMLFAQTAAPVGWTKDVVHDNKALRLVSGAASSGGSNAFTTVFNATFQTDGHSLTAAQNGPHHHPNSIVYGGGPSVTGDGPTPVSTASANDSGSGEAHAHGMSMNVAYVDVIIATKD